MEHFIQTRESLQWLSSSKLILQKLLVSDVWWHMYTSTVHKQLYGYISLVDLHNYCANVQGSCIHKAVYGYMRCTFLPSMSGKAKTLSKLTLLCYYLAVDHVRDLTLAVCVWEAPSHDLHSKPTCHLGIFDINCWYHSQMPPSIR